MATSRRNRYGTSPPPQSMFDNGWICNLPGSSLLIGSHTNPHAAQVYGMNIFGMPASVPTYSSEPTAMRIVGDKHPVFVPVDRPYFTDPFQSQYRSQSPQPRPISPAPMRVIQQSPAPVRVIQQVPVQTPKESEVPLFIREIRQQYAAPQPRVLPVVPTTVTITTTGRPRRTPTISCTDEFVTVDGTNCRVPPGHREITISTRSVTICVRSAYFAHTLCL